MPGVGLLFNYQYFILLKRLISAGYYPFARLQALGHLIIHRVLDADEFSVLVEEGRLQPMDALAVGPLRFTLHHLQPARPRHAAPRRTALHHRRLLRLLGYALVRSQGGGNTISHAPLQSRQGLAVQPHPYSSGWWSYKQNIQS